MNIRDLRYVVALSETRHFRAAAERCFVSQPTLSGQIQKLEGELGLRLFERNNRRVEITPDGATIVQQVYRALEEIEQISTLAAQMKDPMSGVLRIGMIPTLAPYLIPRFLGPLEEHFPSLSVQIVEAVTGELVNKLTAHQLDAVLIADKDVQEDLKAVPLFDEPFSVIHPVDHPFYLSDTVTLRRLEREPLLMLSDEHCITGQIRELIDITAPEHDFTAASMQTLLQLVSNGNGCTVVPIMATTGSWMSDMGIVAKSIREKRARRRVSLVYRKTFPRAEPLLHVAAVICESLPNTVRRLPGGRQNSPGGLL